MFLTPLLALALAGNDACPSAGISAVRQCYSDFFNSFNMTLFPDYATYSTYMNRNFEQTIPGFDQECAYRNTLISCLGAFDAACVNGTVFMQNFGVNSNDAFAYAGEYFESKYYCNAGYPLMINNFDCMVKMENSPATGACTAMAAGDVQNGKICKAYTDTVYCFGNVYTQTCGPAVSPLVCNMLQFNIQAQAGQSCKLFDCSVPFPYNGTTTAQ